MAITLHQAKHVIMLITNHKLKLNLEENGTENKYNDESLELALNHPHSANSIEIYVINTTSGQIWYMLLGRI